MPIFFWKLPPDEHRESAEGFRDLAGRLSKRGWSHGEDLCTELALYHEAMADGRRSDAIKHGLNATRPR